jgi:hypothetical protein
MLITQLIMINRGAHVIFRPISALTLEQRRYFFSLYHHDGYRHRLFFFFFFF